MPRFEPFATLRYADRHLDDLIAAPYDVLAEHDIDELAARHEHNIVHVDVPRERDGPDRYDAAAKRLAAWVDDGVLVLDPQPSFTIYRMSFRTDTGADHQIVGVLGALEVVDDGAGGVLPHERTTPKASTDRLDLTRATQANLSPIWGLSLAGGLTALLAEPGEPIGAVTVEGVEHAVERVTEGDRLAAIAACVAADDVLIADGHHRYGVARTYRDELRAATGDSDTLAELTLAFVNELVEEQLSVEPIHRVYTGADADVLRGALGTRFILTDAGPADDGFVRTASAAARLAVVWPDRAEWLEPRKGAFAGERALDGLWLEQALADVAHGVEYQHDATAAVAAATSGSSVAAVLTRPVSLEEITRTAREGLLMPPKSTFFTPKLRTGFVIRPL